VVKKRCDGSKGDEDDDDAKDVEKEDELPTPVPAGTLASAGDKLVCS